MDEMREALKGDRERAEARREASQENVLASVASPPEHEPLPEPEHEPEPAPERANPLRRLFGRR